MNLNNAAPRVSVVMPFLDAERFIGEAIDSVLSQTLTDSELLLIDDGSRDGSVAIAREYAARFPERVRYFEHAGHVNRGKSVSRNLGIAQARGPYLTFLDADDVFLPHKLAHQLELLACHPQAVMVYGNTEYWVSWDPAKPRRKRDRQAKLGVHTEHLYAPPDLLIAWLRKPGSVPCICGLLARTAVARAAAFDERIQNLYEDQIFLVKMLLAGPVYVEAGCGERYRQHAGSTSALAMSAGEYHPRRSNAARLAYLEWLRSYLHEQGWLEGQLQHALARAFWPYRHPFLYRLRLFT